MTNLLECRNVTKKFGSRHVLTGVDWNLSQGEVNGLVGESGAGKTTLVRIIAGLERPTAGSMASVTDRSTNKPLQIGMVFQNLALWPHLTVRKHIEYVLPKRASQAKHEFIEATLREVQLPEQVWNSRPGQLSGGEAQRLALARAIAPGPELLLLDEPLAQVDMPLRQALIQLIRGLAKSRTMTIVCVSHSWADLLQLCDQLAVLDQGRIVQQGRTSVVYFQPLSARVAQLTGPVVPIPRSLIELGKIGIDQQPEFSSAHAELCLRPQQVAWGPPDATNAWQLQSARPYYLGWKCELLDSTAHDAAGEHATLCIMASSRPDDYVSIHVTTKQQ